MTRRAVCVGINQFETLPRSSWLQGCVNDAEDVARALRGHGFTARNTTVLTDGEATKKKVMGALTAMVRNAKAGDQLVFSFSSHGTQVPDTDGDEGDRLDEAFACHDLAQSGDQWDRTTVILDDELRTLFASVPEGVLLEVLLDTCHSGTGLRDLDEIQQDLVLGRQPRYLPPPTAVGLDRTRSLVAAGAVREGVVELTRGRAAASRPVLYAACRPAQTAADATFEGRPNGAFTHLFLQALAEDPTRTRRELQVVVTKGLRQGRFEQRSTLEGAPRAKKVAFGQLW